MRSYATPQSLDFPHNAVLKGEVSPEIQIDLLEKYLALTPHLLPARHEEMMSRPTLRHPGILSSFC